MNGEAASKSAAAGRIGKSPGYDRNTARWRWVFLCCETSLLTLLVVSEMQWANSNHKGIDNFYYLIRATIVEIVLTVTIGFLFFVSPFFFRRLGLLAVISWVTALAEFVLMNLPEF